MFRSPVKTLPYSNIFMTVMAGFDDQLKHYFFDRTIPVVPLSNDSELSVAAKLSNRDNIKFPFFARRFASIEEITDQRNNFLLRNEGASLRDNAGKWYQFRLIPIRITVTVNLLSLNDSEMYLFSQRWIDCSRMHFMYFYMNFHDNNILVRVNCENNISYPDLSSDGDTGPMFNCETTATIDGYMGSITPVSALKQINANYIDALQHPPQVMQNRVFVYKDDGIYVDNVKISE